IEIALGTGGVHLCVSLAIVGFLVNDQGLGAGADQRTVFVRLHRPDFDRDRREVRGKRAHAVREIITADELGMLTRDEQDLTESLGCEMPRLSYDLGLIEG